MAAGGQYPADVALTPSQVARAKDKLDKLSPEEISALVTDYKLAKQKKWLLETYADLGLTPSQVAEEKEKLDDLSPGEVNAMVSPPSPLRNQPYQGPTTVVTESDPASDFIENDEYASDLPAVCRRGRTEELHFRRQSVSAENIGTIATNASASANASTTNATANILTACAFAKSNSDAAPAQIRSVQPRRGRVEMNGVDCGHSITKEVYMSP